MSTDFYYELTYLKLANKRLQKKREKKRNTKFTAHIEKE